MIETQTSIPKIGFIILRHVSSELHNQYWINCYNCIRKFYDYNIIIIDDNSNPEYLTIRNDLINCEIIQSEFPKCGELLPYYYFYKYHFFHKAIIIQDSVFIQKYIDFTNYEDVKFIWHFDEPGLNVDYYYYPLIENISLLKNTYKTLGNKKLVEFLKNFHLNEGKQKGCFGVMSVIDFEFLQKIENVFGLFDLIPIINNRNNRCALERIFSGFCLYLKPDLIYSPSIFGEIYQYLLQTNMIWGFNFNQYNALFPNFISHNIPIVKVWSGR